MATNDKWLMLANGICDDAGVQADDIEIITTWEQNFIDSDEFRNNAVFRMDGGRILKIFKTDAERNQAVECASLEILKDRFPAPRYIADGNFEGRPYLIMSEIEGDTLETLWGDLPKSELLFVAREIGKQSVQLHQCPTSKLAEVEAQYGRGEHEIDLIEADRIAEIKALDRLSTYHKDELLQFVHDQPYSVLTDSLVLNHGDLSHAHIYLTHQNQNRVVSGWVDWGGAIVASPEWDITFHWFWTFSQERDAMREFLKSYYDQPPKPDQLARRCFIAHFYTFSMGDVWDYFTAQVKPSDSIVDALITSLYPPELFGLPG